LRADSLRLVAQYQSPDTTLRTLPDAPIPGRCARRLAEDSAGFGRFAPVLLSRDHRITFMRDLHSRDSLIEQHRGGQQLWLLTQGLEPGAPLRFELIDADSMHREWSLP